MLRKYLYKFVLIILLVPTIWVLFQLEFEKPSLKFIPDIKYIGKIQPLSIDISDRKTGLRKIYVGIGQNGKDKTIHSQSFPYSLLRKDRVHQVNLNLEIEPRTLGFRDGEATLTVSVKDYSLKGFFRGNHTLIKRKIIIDTLPPHLTVLTSFHYLNRGGSGLIIYKIHEEIARSGVKMGDLFFPGFKGKLSQKEVYLAYFAVPHNVSSPVRMDLVAKDYAGNETVVEFPYHVRKKIFMKDKIRLSKDFLSKVKARFASKLGSPDGPLDIFLWVNGRLRSQNHQRIFEICSKTHQEQLWDGPFLRMKRSKPMAGYAGKRTYYYRGKPVDRQVHLGVDLASTAHSPVEAANNGIVAFADDLGIYGNTIILDHGLGLFSMYGHLSNIQITTGQKVRKGELIGYTGSTGLAGGDHLHFSMIVSGVFVNPIEWWDKHWIQDNVVTKLRNVGG